MSLHDPLSLMCVLGCIGVLWFVLYFTVTLAKGRPGKP